MQISAVTLAICLGTAIVVHSVPSGGVVAVSQKNRTFNPDRLTIALGAVVHIMNDDNVTHHVYVDAPNMKFDSGEQPVGATVDLRFDEAGTFLVRCAIHPTMRLTVTVK